MIFMDFKQFSISLDVAGAGHGLPLLPRASFRLSTRPRLRVEVQNSFEFVALRIGTGGCRWLLLTGWCLYERPTDLRGEPYEDYLRCMFLSRRDFRGYLRACLQCDLSGHQGSTH